MTKDIARMVLLRANPAEADHLPSIRLLASRLNTSMPTVREALQRLIAVGLVRLSKKEGSRVEPIPRMLSGDGLVLLVHAAAQRPDKRRQALCHLLETARFTIIEGLALAAGLDGLPHLHIAADLAEVVRLLAEPDATDRAARAIFRLAWYSADAAGEVALRLLGAAIGRACPHVLPWLRAAIRVPLDQLRWKAVHRQFELRDGPTVRTAVQDAWCDYQKRVLALAEYDDPCTVVLENSETEDDGLPF